MIIVETTEDTNKGIRTIWLTSNNSGDESSMDSLLEAIVGSYPRRGGYAVGAPNPTLRIEVNIGKKDV